MLDGRKAHAVKYKAGMSKIDQYRRALEFCLFNAEKAPFDELRALWQTIGESYVFLAQIQAARHISLWRDSRAANCP
jgi:hypothetical protein